MDKHLSKEEAVRRHRELWNKIADMQAQSENIIHKDDALISLGYTEFPLNNCWCCEYGSQRSTSGICSFCPIQWPEKYEIHEKLSDSCVQSYYHAWLCAIWIDDMDEAVKIARIIAELPEAEFEDGTDGDLNSIFP